jgi:hypothetical protein
MCMYVKRSPRGKYTWILYSNQVISESQDRNNDPSFYLTSAERTFQNMAEDRTHRAWVLEHGLYDIEQHNLRLSTILNVFLDWMAPSSIYKTQGPGRHIDDEVMDLMKADMHSLSDFRGRKKFVIGVILIAIRCVYMFHCSSVL